MEDHWVTCTVGNSIAKEGMKGLLRTAFSSTGGKITIRPTVLTRPISRVHRPALSAQNMSGEN